MDSNQLTKRLLPLEKLDPCTVGGDLPIDIFSMKWTSEDGSNTHNAFPILQETNKHSTHETGKTKDDTHIGSAFGPGGSGSRRGLAFLAFAAR